MGALDLYPEDPESEYVDINNANMAMVTLQENNHIIIVNLVSGEKADGKPACSFLTK